MTSQVFTQESVSLLPVITNESKTLKVSDLELNGINSSAINSVILHEDLIKLRNFDFSVYRLFDNSQKIQIQDGPMIELYSIEKMIVLGQVFSTDFINSKNGVDNSSVTHDIIPLVNIGFGKTQAIELH